MRYREVTWFILAVLSIMILGGCSSVHTVPVKPVVPVVAPDGPILARGEPVRLGGTQLEPSVHPVARRGEVYFTTGSDVVTEDSAVTMRKIARFLRQHPGVNVTIEGNCDERGSAAYNQRLGARRAANVAKILTESGVAPGRVSTVSSGKLKPLAACHAEVCWSMNRRADVIYGGW